MWKRLWWILMLFILVSCIFMFTLVFAYIPYQYGLLITLFLVAVLLIDKFRHRISIKDPKKFSKQLLVVLASCANFTGAFILRLFWNLDLLIVLVIILVFSFLVGLLLEEAGESIFGVCFSLVAGGFMASFISVSPLLARGEDSLIVQYYFWQALQKVVPVFLLALGLAFVGALSANILRDIFQPAST